MNPDRNNRVAALRVSVGQAIATARRARGMLQRVVASELGVEQETISRMERGETLPTLDRLLDLALLFDVPIAVFFAGEPGPAAPLYEELKTTLSLLSEQDQSMVVSQAMLLTRALARHKNEQVPTSEGPV